MSHENKVLTFKIKTRLNRKKLPKNVVKNAKDELDRAKRTSSDSLRN